MKISYEYQNRKFNVELILYNMVSEVHSEAVFYER